MNPEKARFDSLDNVFMFGKHRGQLLCDVVADDPTYLYWCANTIPEFSLDPKVINEIRVLFPNFIISEILGNHILTTEQFADKYQEEYEDWDNLEDEDWEVYHEKPTYGRYAGSWAQDVEGYSDNDIDDIFDGDPLAYWNID